MRRGLFAIGMSGGLGVLLFVALWFGGSDSLSLAPASADPPPVCNESGTISVDCGAAELHPYLEG
jgi:hypothetical protein